MVHGYSYAVYIYIYIFAISYVWNTFSKALYQPSVKMKWIMCIMEVDFLLILSSSKQKIIAICAKDQFIIM